MRNKILFIETGVFEGGSFVSLVKHIEALDKMKVEPIIIFFNENKWLKIFKEKGYIVYLIHDNVFSRNNGKIHTVLNAFFMKGFIKGYVISYLKWLHKDAILQIENIITRDQIRYVHLNTELFRDRVGLIAAANKGVPIISHLRSKYELGKVHFSKEYVEFANKHVRKYIAVSNDTATFWINEVNLTASKFQILYDYFNPIGNEFNDNVCKYDGLKLLCVGNIIPVKGYEFLLESCAPILKEFSAKLFVLGRGEEDYINSIKVRIERLGIQNAVELVGYRNNVSDFIQNSDVVLLFSKREGLPNVIIESMGVGAIVIASNVGGIPEIVTDEENGFLVDYGNVSAATAKIRSILNKEVALLKHVREKAIKTVEVKFSKEKYSSLIERLYE